MTVSLFFQIVLFAIAALLFWWAWTVPEPYGGDAGLGDAIAKLLGYGTCALLLLIVVIWVLCQHIQFH